MASDKVKITLQELLDDAFGECRVLPQNISAEMLAKGQRALQDMLDALSTHVTPLWARDQQLVALPPLASRIPMPADSIDVITLVRREWRQRHEGPIIDYELGQTVELNGREQIDVIGVMLKSSKTLSYRVEHSQDGGTYTTLYEVRSRPHVKGVMAWYLIEPTIQANYVRITGLEREDMQEIFLGMDPYDTPVERVNHENFHFLPAARTGSPIQFWVDRQADEPVLCVWPKPTSDDTYRALALWRQRHIHELGALYETVEIPRRWKEGITSMLAYRIAMKTPQIDITIVNTLKPLADEMKLQLSADERDPAPVTVNFGIRGYTR